MERNEGKVALIRELPLGLEKQPLDNYSHLPFIVSPLSLTLKSIIRRHTSYGH
jgi:hypothetical protein